MAWNHGSEVLIRALSPPPLRPRQNLDTLISHDVCNSFASARRRATQNSDAGPYFAKAALTGGVRQISRLKTIKRTMNGRGGFDLLRHRVLEAA
jgi:hypothetical protein